MKFQSDIDIDFADRDQALAHLSHVPASMYRDHQLVKHISGVHVTEIPVDPFMGIASLDYKTAEQRGYMKLDFLNMAVYQHVRNEAHLQELMAREPAWHRLYDETFFNQLVHVNGHYNTLIAMPEAVNSIPRMAMFLSVMRPAKRHLIGKSWVEVAEHVWERPVDDAYYFKKAHAVSYSHLVVVHMNLLDLANQGD